MRWSLLIASMAAGCAPVTKDYTGDYLPVIAVACGVATVTTDDAPGPAPTPDGVPRPADCPDLCNNGVLGDGVTVFDCPTCDRDGDGDPNDSARTPLSAPSPVSGLSRDAADGAGWLTWEEALGEQAETGRPILVFQHFADPAMAASCKPCKVLANLLAEPGVLDRVAELGIPATDTVERWQPKSHRRTAPAIAHVPQGAKRGAKVSQLTGFALDDADAFLASLKAWLDGI